MQQKESVQKWKNTDQTPRATITEVKNHNSYPSNDVNGQRNHKLAQ